jgi:hypothetical protein
MLTIATGKEVALLLFHTPALLQESNMILEQAWWTETTVF